jgi:HAD superfamily hydrolase (TIGR01509 family)
MVIFDFDQTLVDTSAVEDLRAARNWKAVMARASALPVYDGVTELLKDLHAKGLPLAIVTKSPDMVPKAFIREHKWPIKIVIGYHQVKRPKPDPQGLLLAMEKGDASPEETFHVGDRPEDTEASRLAGVTALGAAWGIENVDALKASRPDAIFPSVAELREYLHKYL